MARVHTAKAAKDYPEYGIKKGDTYFWWQLYKQPKRMSKDRPRPSQLTGSAKLSAAYAAQEAAEDAVVGSASTEDLVEALRQAAEDARSVAEEYEESASSIRETFSESSTADECEEKAEALNDWADELEQACDEIESLDRKDFEEGDEGDEEFANAACEIAEAAIGNLSI